MFDGNRSEGETGNRFAYRMTYWNNGSETQFKSRYDALTHYNSFKNLYPDYEKPEKIFQQVELAMDPGPPSKLKSVGFKLEEQYYREYSENEFVLIELEDDP